MSEPKKETVRIVLPPRREGQPATSTPRETAMINLPPKPVPAASAPAVPAPPSAPSVPKPPSPPSAPHSPSGITPPSAPGIKPPSVPGVKVPSAPGVPVAPSGAKPASVAPPGFRPPSVSAPAAVKPAASEVAAKVASSAGKPQATVRLQPRPQPAAPSASSAFKVQSVEAEVESADSNEIPMNLTIVALLAAAVALVSQVLMML